MRSRIRLLEAREAYDRTVYAVYPHSRHIAGKVRAFLDHLVDHFRPDRLAIADAEDLARGSSRAEDLLTCASHASISGHSALSVRLKPGPKGIIAGPNAGINHYRQSTRTCRT